MGDAHSTATLIFQHCFGAAEPTLPLLRTGVLPPGWAETYMSLAQRAESEMAGLDEWPRELVAAAYLASVYCEKRYRDWRDAGGAENADTENALRQIRWVGDKLIMGWALKWRNG